MPCSAARNSAAASRRLLPSARSLDERRRVHLDGSSRVRSPPRTRSACPSVPAPVVVIIVIIVIIMISIIIISMLYYVWYIVIITISISVVISSITSIHIISSSMFIIKCHSITINIINNNNNNISIIVITIIITPDRPQRGRPEVGGLGQGHH